METMGDKENVAPATSSDPLRKGLTPSPKSSKKTSRKGRSKSIGPGSLDEHEPSRLSAKDRRKSAFVPATKSILSKDEEASRAARRKSMANRRVSFAPEATLHTWDIIVDHAEHTTSTNSEDSTRRASEFSRASGSPAPSSDAAQEEEDRQLLSPDSENESHARKNRRSSGIPPMNFNNPDDAYSSSGMSGSDDSGSDDGAEGDSDDETGTAMSLDVDDATMQSAAGSEDSTGSSLTARLQQASQTAGTRGIEYDEFGDMSMDVAENEITNALQPWAQQNVLDRIGSASMDQENVNPFSPAFKAEIVAQQEDGDDNEEDMSMDVPRAVGGIMQGRAAAHMQSSPVSEEDGTMDLTRAVGSITGSKRRRSTTADGSPGAVVAEKQPKRRRSSVARSSTGGDETMDLTVAVGSIQPAAQRAIPDRRRSLRSRRSSGINSDSGDATMDMTTAVGAIKPRRESILDDSFDGNEELSMELTTVLGGIREDALRATDAGSRPVTPPISQSPRRSANNTPKDQERFKQTPDLGAKQLLGPVLQQQSSSSTEKQASVTSGRKSLSPMRLSQYPVQRQSNSPSRVERIERIDAPASLSQPSPKQACSYPVLPQPLDKPSPLRTPTSSPKRRSSRRDVSSNQRRFDQELQAPIQSPTASKQQRGSPAKNAATTPDKLGTSDDSGNLHDTIRLMATPRKELLKNVTPKKQTPAKQLSPKKGTTPRARPTPKGPVNVLPSLVRQLTLEVASLRADGNELAKVGLHDFLQKAGIRFMDLTTTKRRLTTAVPPSKIQNSQDLEAEDVNLENSIVAAACTIPELELYQHACHELKRFAKEGKQFIGELEEQTLQDQPPLLQAYMHVGPGRKLELDAQMRDMKTNARLRSKEMWYGWRSKLLDDLMNGLSRIGEGLIQDDETMGQSEQLLDQVLPSLIEQHRFLKEEAGALEQTANAVPEEEKEQLKEARESLRAVNAGFAEKRQLLESLRKQVEAQDEMVEHLQDSKTEFTAAIQEANRVREACRGVSLDEIAALKDSVKSLEETYNWSITSASSNPPTVTMVYKSELQLFFHPQSFNNTTTTSKNGPSNAAISLTYIADTRPCNKKPLTTTLRFFLQLLRASLHALPQCDTRLADLLGLVSGGWDTATQIAESERRLCLEGPTRSSIVGDERLDINCDILLPKVKTKVRSMLALEAKIDENLELQVDVTPKVDVVYGEQYNEKNMTEFLKGLVGGSVEGWDDAMRQMREKLIARGAKGVRK